MRTDLTDITIVLDRSGSMLGIKDSTIKGFNDFVKAQQESKIGETVLSLIQFDNNYLMQYTAKPVAIVEPLNDRTFEPRGSTALLGAIGLTIDQVGRRLAGTDEKDRPGKVIIVTMTDGQENASTWVEWARDNKDIKTIHDKISHQRDAYKWEFVFLGANLDAIATAASFGISAGNTMQYRSTSASATNVFRAMNKGIETYKGDAKSSGGIFASVDRDAVATGAPDIDKKHTKEALITT